ncbi:apolipoprotein D-like, partial [Elysia marginata]
YKGTWYEYKRFPAFFEIGLECTTARYTSGDGGAVNVMNKGLLRVPFFGTKLVVSTSSISGTAVVPNSQRPAELIALFGDDQAAADDAGCIPNYIIQDTDYKSYSVVFSCVEVLGFNVQFAWILTRCAGVAPANLTELETNLKTAGVDVSKFELANQDDCPLE